MEKTDHELIESYLNGDDASLEQIFQRYRRPVFNFALRLLRQRADAEDVTAEVFTMLIAKKYQPQPEAKLSTWLYTVARNSSISRLRQRKRLSCFWFLSRDGGDETAWEPPDERDIPQKDMIKKEQARAVRDAVAALQGLQRDALILREYQRLSYAEISAVLGVSLPQVKVLIFRARENVKNKIVPLMTEGQNDGS